MTKARSDAQSEGVDCVQSSGFAIVIALSFMAFVLLILLSFTLLVRVSTVTASNQLGRELAKNNALLALNLALGELQESVGPDQRVTARADILSDSLPSGNAFWTGVWDNRAHDESDPRPDDTLVYASNRDSLGKLPRDGTYMSNPNAPRWLVSMPEGFVPDPLTSLFDETALTNEDLVVIAEQTEVGAENRVVVGKVDIRSGNDSTGGFAWWVGDEGVKANVKLPASRRNRWKAPGGGDLNSHRLFQQLIARTLSGSAMDLLAGADWYEPVQVSDAEKLSSFGQLGLLFDVESSGGTFMEVRDRYRHDLTVHSYGVLSDVQNGGLKVDLSRALEEQWPDFLMHMAKAQGRPIDGANTIDYEGITWAEPAPIFVAPFPDDYVDDPLKATVEDGARISGPPWDILYSHYHAYKPESPYTMYIDNDQSTNVKNFYNFYYNGYSSAKLPDYSDVNELNSYLFPTVTGEDMLYGPPGLNDPSSTNPEIHTVATGPVVFQGLVPDSVDYYAYESDYQVGEPIRMPDFRNRGEPVWDSKAPIMVAAGARLAISSSAPQEPDYLSISAAATPGDPSDDVRYLNLHYYPYVILWNPYNVTLKARKYHVESNYYLPIQLYHTAGIPTESELLLKTYGDSQSPPPDEWGGGIYDLEPHKFGVSLHRLMKSNRGAVKSDYIQQPGDDGSDAKYTVGGVQFALFDTEEIAFGPGEYLIFSPETDAETQPFRDIQNKAPFANAYDPDKGFIIPLIAVPHYKERSPRFISAIGGQKWNYAKPIPADSQNDIVMRFYHQGYGEEGKTEGGYAGQGEFALWLKHAWGVLLGSGMGDVMFTPSPSSGVGDYTDVNLGPANTYEGIPIDVAYIGWRLGETENAGSRPIYSVLNPRLMNNTNFLGTDKDGEAIHLEAQTLDTFALLSTNGVLGVTEYEPQVSAGAGGKVLASAGGSYDASGETSTTLFDIPRQPLQSIGDFMHANLSLYDTFPAYAIGNSFASPFLAKKQYSGDKESELLERHIVFPDISYLANDALFDEFFFSTVPPFELESGDPVISAYSKYPSGLFAQFPPYQSVDEAFLEADLPLPNDRMRYLRQEGETSDDYLDALQDFETAASKLLVDGAFNVNSTSIDAWSAFLGGSRALAGIDDSNLILDYYNTVNADDSILPLSKKEFTFPRFSVPSGGKNDKWRGLRILDQDDIRDLATKIVEQVRLRGPFLSMADFINRRLVDDASGLSGALQFAIDASDINAEYLVASGSLVGATSDVPAPSPQAGLPGYLLQNDLLRKLAPQMTVRSDTFTIRAYGETVNPVTGTVIGRAMCEAIVQRVPEYVLPFNSITNEGNEPEDQIYQDAGGFPTSDYTSALDDLNERFGRRFKLVSIRWLGGDEFPTQL